MKWMWCLSYCYGYCNTPWNTYSKLLQKKNSPWHDCLRWGDEWDGCLQHKKLGQDRSCCQNILFVVDHIYSTDLLGCSCSSAPSVGLCDVRSWCIGSVVGAVWCGRETSHHEDPFSLHSLFDHVVHRFGWGDCMVWSTHDGDRFAQDVICAASKYPYPTLPDPLWHMFQTSVFIPTN